MKKNLETLRNWSEKYLNLRYLYIINVMLIRRLFWHNLFLINSEMLALKVKCCRFERNVLVKNLHRAVEKYSCFLLQIVQEVGEILEMDCFIFYQFA